MVRLVLNQADLRGIKIGEDWAFDGWPDPPQDDIEAWGKEDANARATFAKLSEYADKEALKNTTAKSISAKEKLSR